MTIQHYRDTYWYPNGQIASNVPASVFAVGNSAFAPLWANAAGTIPLTNPLLTSATGVLDFWAESGEYWVHLDTETFPVTLGMSQEQADLSTGIASGGNVTVNGLNPLAVDIAAVDGYVLDYSAGTQTAPGIARVKTAAQTVALDAAALLRTLTWWLLDSSGAVVQQPNRPSNIQNRTHLTLAVSALVLGTIVTIQNAQTILPQVGNQLVDLMDGLAPFVVAGNDITPNGVNLSLNHSTGPFFSRSFNHFSGGLPTNNPHVWQTIAQTPAQWRYGTRSTIAFGAPTSLVDVANMDVGGVVTPIGGGANTSTIHTLWLFAANTPAEQMTMQYGQTAYSSLANAVNAIGAGGYIVNPSFIGNGTPVAYIVATRTATDLTNPAQGMIITASRFSTR